MLMLTQANAEAIVIKAEADAKARRIEASSRQEAGDMLTDGFGSFQGWPLCYTHSFISARSYALSGQQVEFAKALKAQSLTVLPDSIVAKPIIGSLVQMK